jgi:hypothetical protein
LRVKGIERLRVIDMSVTVVSGDTSATAIMIGEKGADRPPQLSIVSSAR